MQQEVVNGEVGSRWACPFCNHENDGSRKQCGGRKPEDQSKFCRKWNPAAPRRKHAKSNGNTPARPSTMPPILLRQERDERNIHVNSNDRLLNRSLIPSLNATVKNRNDARDDDTGETTATEDPDNRPHPPTQTVQNVSSPRIPNASIESSSDESDDDAREENNQ